jgi:gluconate 2-dehydrogenase gamma chain
MTRRELIQKTSLALGYTLSGPALIGIMNGCEIKHDKTFTPTFFTDEQAVLIGDLAEIILPRTKTPGAKDAGVPAFIDAFVNEVYSKEEKEKLIEGLNEFNEGTRNRFFRLFIECTSDSQRQYVDEVHNDVFNNAEATSEGWWASNKGEKPFLYKIKELTILGFFSSEAGATQVLQYNPAPGPFQGCVPLDKVGKAWAT